MNSYIWFSYFSLFLSGIFDNARGPLYPLVMSHFNLDHGQTALIFSIASFSGILMLVSSLKIIQKFGIVKTNLFYTALITLSAFGAAGTISLNFNFFVFLFFIFIYGIGAGGSTVTMNLLVSNSSKSEDSRRYLSGLHAMYGMASLLIPLIVSLVLKLNLNFSLNLYLIGMIGVVVFFKFRSLPKFEHLDLHEEQAKAKIPLSHIILWGGTLSLYVCSEILISSRLVVYLIDIKNIEQVVANNYLTMFFVSLLIGRLLFAFLRLPYSNLVLLTISLVSSIAFVILGMVINPIFLTFVGFTMSLFFPYFMDYIVKSFGKNASRLVAACMIFVNVGLMLIHIIFGILSDMIGMEKSMLLSPIMLIIALLIMILILPNTIKKGDLSEG